MNNVNPLQTDIDVSPGALSTDPTPAMLADGAHLSHPNFQGVTMSETTVEVEQEEEVPPQEAVVVTPMPPIPGKEMTLSFQRKIQPKQYESADCFASTKFTLPEDFPIDRLAELVEDEYMKLRSAVYQQLGVAFNLDETTRTLVEQFEGTVVASTAAAPNANAFAGTGFQPAPTTPAAVQQQAPPPAAAPAFAGGQGGGGGGAEPGWAELMADPSQWQDVRASKRSEKSPDFKHLSAKKADGKDVALWIDSQWKPAPPEVRAWLGIQ